jgi:hypothetical protein
MAESSHNQALADPSIYGEQESLDQHQRPKPMNRKNGSTNLTFFLTVYVYPSIPTTSIDTNFILDLSFAPESAVRSRFLVDFSRLTRAFLGPSPMLKNASSSLQKPKKLVIGGVEKLIGLIFPKTNPDESSSTASWFNKS